MITIPEGAIMLAALSTESAGTDTTAASFCGTEAVEKDTSETFYEKSTEASTFKRHGVDGQ